jgi:hypothetical protein
MIHTVVQPPNEKLVRITGPKLRSAVGKAVSAYCRIAGEEWRIGPRPSPLEDGDYIIQVLFARLPATRYAQGDLMFPASREVRVFLNDRFRWCDGESWLECLYRVSAACILMHELAHVFTGIGVHGPHRTRLNIAAGWEPKRERFKVDDWTADRVRVAWHNARNPLTESDELPIVPIC